MNMSMCQMKITVITVILDLNPDDEEDKRRSAVLGQMILLQMKRIYEESKVFSLKIQ